MNSISTQDLNLISSTIKTNAFNSEIFLTTKFLSFKIYNLSSKILVSNLIQKHTNKKLVPFSLPSKKIASPHFYSNMKAQVPSSLVFFHLLLCWNRKFLALKENFQTLTCNWIYGCNTCYRFFCHLYVFHTQKIRKKANRKTFTFFGEMKNYRHFLVLTAEKSRFSFCSRFYLKII